jgi:hypothetical protein
MKISTDGDPFKVVLIFKKSTQERQEEKEMEGKKRLSFWKLLLIALLSATILLGSFVGLYLWKTGAFNLLFSSSDPEEMGLPSWIDPQLIVVDGASRRGEKATTYDLRSGSLQRYAYFTRQT